MIRIIFTGGGTLGSVTPLLAVAAKLKEHEHEVAFLWIGTRYGPEREVVETQNIPYKKIFSGKFRRYFDWRNFIDPLRVLIGFFQSLYYIIQFKPHVIVGAGGFVQVPVMFAALCRKIPIFLHQQDVRPSLSNLIISRFAKKITVSFDDSARHFNKEKVSVTGNPARDSIMQGDRDTALKMFHLEDGIPTVLVLGGGTGARRLNHLIWDALPVLGERVQLIHSIGKRKLEAKRQDALRYHHYEFLGEELAHAYAAADLVVCRAGMGTLTEVSARGLPAILVPIAKTHQVDNARYFETKDAALFFDEGRSAPELATLILDVLNNKTLCASLSNHIKMLYKTDAVVSIRQLIADLTRKHQKLPE